MHIPVLTRALLPDLFYSVFTDAFVITQYNALVKLLLIRKTLSSSNHPVLSANLKLSTSTMVYVAGIFQFAEAINPN